MFEISDDEIVSTCLKHNFWTWSAQKKVDPISVKTAKGVFFWDIHGKRYLDLNSTVMNVNIGHGDERVIDAMYRQLQTLPFAGPGMATRPRAVLCRMLAQITPPGLDKFLFTLGGADANENAIKLARGCTGKHKILARYRSYHGATLGAVAATGDPRRTAWEPSVMPGVVHFLDPYRYRSTFHRTTPHLPDSEFTRDYLNHLEEVILYENPDTIAAVLLETVTGTNGVLIPPPGYLAGVRELCDRHNILMICDEVMSGFGRTGRWFAVEHWDVVPDMITMAKGLTSGYAPLGAVAMSERVASSYDEIPFQGGLTANGHPVCLAAAIETINVIRQDGLLERATQMGGVMSDMLAELANRHPSIGEVRSIGLFGAIELVRNRQSRQPMAPYNSSSSEMVALRKFLLDHGVFLYTHWNIILLMPPLVITESELEAGIEVIDQALGITDQAVITE